jgi:Ca2+-binding RTX toxin-like protein
LQASDDFAFLSVDSTRLKTLAILQKVFNGELYTVEALNEAATSDTSLLTYAAQAVIDWREQANISATDETESQVWSLLETFWRFLDINRDDIDEAVSYINNGGSWESLLLDVVADSNSNQLLYGGTGVMQLAQATEVASSGLQEDIGDDDLTGGAGNDTLVGGHGSDRLDGGDGDDIAIQSRSSEDYQFILTSDGELALVYQDGAYTETDTLVDIEQVQFSDDTLDFFASNLSSSALLQLGTLGQLMVGAAPSLDQLNAYQSDQLSLTGLASAFMQTQTYQEQWQDLDDDSFIAALASQVIDEPFTQNDINYWVARLDSDLNREDVFVLAAGVESYQAEALENGLVLM